MEAARADGALDSMFKEFLYLKPLVIRYEGDPALGIEGEIRKFKRLAGLNRS